MQATHERQPPLLFHPLWQSRMSGLALACYARSAAISAPMPQPNWKEQVVGPNRCGQERERAAARFAEAAKPADAKQDVCAQWTLRGQPMSSSVGWDWNSILEKVAVGVLTAVVLAALALAGNWTSQGGLVRALGGVSEKDVEETIKRLAITVLKGDSGQANKSGLSLIAAGSVGEDGSKIEGFGPFDFLPHKTGPSDYVVRFSLTVPHRPFVIVGSTRSGREASAVVTEYLISQFALH